MKKLLFGILTLTSFSSFAAKCDLAVYLPALSNQSVKYKADFNETLIQKGYTNLELVTTPGQIKTSYLLEFYSQGVFRFDYKASVTLADPKLFSPEGVIFQKEMRTFGGDDFVYFKKLLKHVPRCMNGRII